MSQSANTQVTVVMYHYVRDLKGSRFPRLKGLDLSLFEEQLAYIQRHYTVISMERLIDAIDGTADLPPGAALLTFDDGYIDHFTQVFPRLRERGIPGAFFVPRKTVMERVVLDVNKIHFILASVDSEKPVIRELYGQLDALKASYELESGTSYFDRLAVQGKLDTKETVFIKQLLQAELPEEPRRIVLDHLFKTFVHEREEEFSRELYMNISQIRAMRSEGMHIGAHGDDHVRLSLLPRERQESEIEGSLRLIEAAGGDVANWSMAYPYGSYNDDTIGILERRGCKAALESTGGVANELMRHHRLKLPRIDTIDLLKSRDAKAVQHTTMV